MHGANDAQETMGIIAGVYFTAGYLKTFEVTFWVVLLAHRRSELRYAPPAWRAVNCRGR